LTTSEVHHLKTIAESDQAAADWKNGFLTIGILAFLLATIQASSGDISVFLSEYVLVPPPPPGQFISGWQDILILIMWLSITSLTLLFSLTVFRPLGQFLVIEPLNRTLLNACQDAIALLEAKGYSNKDALTLKDKKIIAALCDCLIVPKINQRKYQWQYKIDSFECENKKVWLLLPPAAKYEEEKHRKRTRWITAIRGWIHKIIKNSKRKNRKR